MTYSFNNLIRGFCLIHMLLFSVTGIALAEEIEVKLGANALKDPLIEFVMPPDGSPDQVQFVRDGILVTQSADVPGKRTGVTGFKLLTTAEGDFEFRLDVEVRKLRPPTEGWGHGVMIRVLLDDESQPIISGGCVAQKSDNLAFLHQVMRDPNDKTERARTPFQFKTGEITLSRIEGETILSVRPDGGEEREVSRLPCSRSSVSEIQVWCTRLTEGNSEANYLLKNVKFKAGNFFVYKEPKERINWWMVLRIAIISGGVVAAMVYFWKRRVRDGGSE